MSFNCFLRKIVWCTFDGYQGYWCAIIIKFGKIAMYSNRLGTEISSIRITSKASWANLFSLSFLRYLLSYPSRKRMYYLIIVITMRRKFQNEVSKEQKKNKAYLTSSQCFFLHCTTCISSQSVVSTGLLMLLKQLCGHGNAHHMFYFVTNLMVEN